MEKKEFKIHKNMKVRELLKLYPQSAKILYEMGFDCLNCKGADEEPLYLAAQMHGWSEDEFIKIIKNKIAKRGSKR